MRILLINNSPKWTALEYYRQILPHRAMVRNFTDVTVFTEMPDEKFAIDKLSDEELKTYDIVCFLRQCISDHGDPIERCRRLGLKVVFDIDDYWNLPPDHNLKEAGRRVGYEDKVIDWMRRADLVTTTTPYFADVISHVGGVEKIEVLANCIDPLEPQFEDIEPTRSTLVRFGWIGGVHHRPDLDLIAPTFAGFAKDRKKMKGIQFVLGGFNPNREYLYIEKLMTSNYNLFRQDRAYIDYLLQFTPGMEHYSLHKPYRRLWAQDVRNYAGMYNEIDVALIPLRGNKFSACKSELKVLEAGWFKKAVICTDTMPYNTVINDDVNGLLSRSRYWSEEMGYMMDTEYRKDMGEALHETIKDRFDIDKWSTKRYEIYKGLLG